MLLIRWKDLVMKDLVHCMLLGLDLTLEANKSQMLVCLRSQHRSLLRCYSQPRALDITEYAARWFQCRCSRSHSHKVSEQMIEKRGRGSTREGYGTRGHACDSVKSRILFQNHLSISSSLVRGTTSRKCDVTSIHSFISTTSLGCNCYVKNCTYLVYTV